MSGIQSPTSVGNGIGQVLVRCERRVNAVYQVSGRRSLPNLNLLNPEKVQGPVLELDHCHKMTYLFLYLYLMPVLSIPHLGLQGSGLNLNQD